MPNQFHYMVHTECIGANNALKIKKSEIFYLKWYVLTDVGWWIVQSIAFARFSSLDSYVVINSVLVVAVSSVVFLVFDKYFSAPITVRAL